MQSVDLATDRYANKVIKGQVVFKYRHRSLLALFEVGKVELAQQKIAYF